MRTHERAQTSSGAPGKLPRREYGRTGIRLSIVGLGGLVVTDAEQDHANRLVAEAVERGLNYFDVGPAYGDAEVKLGPALKPYRKDAFLACKTGQRQREGASAELKRSLERLHTDHFDLYQLHALRDVKEHVEAAFAKGGAMEVFIEAKKSGQVRYLGFSAHSVDAALRAMELYDFDSILLPINFACTYKGKFGPQVIQKARDKGMAVLGLKAMARQRWPESDPQREEYDHCWYQPLTDRHEAELGIRFALSQPVTAIIPPGHETLFRLALDVATDFRPLSEKEEHELKSLADVLTPIFPL